MTTSGCDVSSRCFSSSTVLLIPFALSCRIFISLCLVLFVFCLLCVWECAGMGTCGGIESLYLLIVCRARVSWTFMAGQRREMGPVRSS